MTYSIDFRRKVLEIEEREGLSFEELSVRFGIGQASVFQWSKRLFPCLNRNKPAVKIDMDALARDVEEQPDTVSAASAMRCNVSQSAVKKRFGIEVSRHAEDSWLCACRQALLRTA